MPEVGSDAQAPADVDPVLVAYLAGQADAADRFVAEYGTVIREAIGRFLALRVRSRVDLVDDLTHEVFLALFRDDGRKLRTFAGRDGCSLAGWLRSLPCGSRSIGSAATPESWHSTTTRRACSSSDARCGVATRIPRRRCKERRRPNVLRRNG
jgi:hypothetical protein